MKRIVCAILFVLPILFGGVSMAQLTPACSPTYTSGSVSWNISSVSIGSSFTHSPSYSVHDYTSRSFTVDAGSPVSLTLISRGWCAVGTAADFNNDGDFDDPDERFPRPAYIAADPATYTFNINIPATILPGSYRFRIFNIEANSGVGVPAGSPCGTYGYGSWVDYTMIVVNNMTCLPPSGATVSNIQAFTADLRWNKATTPASGYLWKVVNRGDDPSLVAGVASGYTIDTFATAGGLVPATRYDLYVKSDCGNSDSSLWTLPVGFETLCDGVPDAGTASASKDSACAGTSFDLQLANSSSGSSISYQWQSSPANQGSWTNVTGSNAASVNLSLNNTTDYRAIVTCAGSNRSDTSNVVTVGQLPGIQCYCIPTYSYGCASYMIDDFLLDGESNTSINDLNTGCAPGGYDDRTNQSVDLFLGEKYPGQIASRSSSNNARIWIDYNDNGLFEKSEIVAEISGISSNLTSFDLVIPDTARAGSHRMRVRSVWLTAAGSIEPCPNYSYGEAHDYMVNLIAPTGCLSPKGLSIINITNDEATFTWVGPVLGDPVADYDFEIRESGAVGSGSAGLVESGFNVRDTFVNLNGLRAGVRYTAYVRTNCTGTGQSDWSKGVEFILPTYVPIVLEGFNADVIANGIGPAAASTTNDVDGANYALVAQDFQASASSTLPTAFVPGSRNIHSGEEKWFILQDYDKDNSLRLSGASQTGTLTFKEPKRSISVHILGVSGSGISSLKAEVWFEDGTTETFDTLSYPDWYATTGTIIVSGVGRINTTTDRVEAPGPKLYENSFEVADSNQAKHIDSIVFTTGTNSAGVMNIMAISVIPIPCVDPIVDLGNDTVICYGESIMLDAENPELKFEWNNDSDNQTLEVNTTGTYAVTVTDGSCSASDTVAVTVIPLPRGAGIHVWDNEHHTFEFEVEDPIGITDYFWDFGDGTTGSGAKAIHRYAKTGTYAVKVIISNECDQDTLFTAVDAYLVDIEEVTLDKDAVKLYPNPANDRIIIENRSGFKTENISIFNLLGQLVYKIDYPLEEKQYQINVSQLPPGIYTLHMQIGERIVTKKVEVLR